MKVATWNVNGIRAREAQVLEWLERDAPDVVCLQEIKASPEQVPPPLCDPAGYWCHWHGFKGYSGVALLLRRERFAAAPAYTHPPFDQEQRIVVAEAGDRVFASVYVPNGGKDLPAKILFMKEMERWAGALAAAGKKLVLCGDMNVTRSDLDVHPRERKPSLPGQLPEERGIFEATIAHDLVDVARHLRPDDAEMFTWWAPWRNMRQRNIGWRLDYVLAHRDLVGPEVRCETYREVGTSDHAPVIAWLRD